VAIKKVAADVIDTVGQIQDVVDEYGRIAPPGLEMNLVNDMSYYVRRRLGVLVNNGWIGITLVMACLFFFLSARVALVTALGIPVAFLTTFIVMYATGLTINLLTMFGLIMVLGMIVDDAIIIAENVCRHEAEGMPLKVAAVQGAHEIWRPVLTTVITTIAAFGPLMFMSGIIGKFVMYIPLVVVIALMASITEAFLILPSHLVTVEQLPHSRLLGRLHTGWCDRCFERFQKRYVSLLRRIIRWRYPVFGGVITFFLISAYLGIFHIPFVLFPQRGIDAFFIRARAPVGTPVERMGELMLPLEEVVATLPRSEMDNFITQVGVIQRRAEDPETERASHVGQIVVYLKPQADRSMTADELIDQLRKGSVGIGGFTELLFEKVRPGPPVGRAVEARVKGEDLAELDSIAEKLRAFLEGIPGVNNVKDDYERGKDEIRVVVNEQEASRAGLAVEDVALSVRASLDGAIATTIKRSDEEIDVRVRYPDALRYRQGVLEEIQIPNPGGHLVPITAVASFDRAPGVTAIKHVDRKRSITVTADVDEVRATAIGVTSKIVRWFREEIAKDHPDVTIAFGGEWEKTQESLDSLKIAAVMAVFIIFIVLAFQFQSLLQPLIVLIAIPYGFIGVVWAFLFHMEPKSFVALFGAIGLAGIVVNNSIVLIDFINKAKAKGMSLREAIIEAASMRLRPILLTTITTVFGLLPVAYGIMGADPFLEPMALAIGWGLAFATCCTLLFTPCLYAVIDDVHRKITGRITFWRDNRNNLKQ
jgi:multidrug efflux pump subunit AcrB